MLEGRTAVLLLQLLLPGTCLYCLPNSVLVESLLQGAIGSDGQRRYTV